MHRRWTGIGWTLALLALLGHVAGADCCLIRGAVRETLERASAPAPAPAAHACCTGAADAPADTEGGDAPLPDCCGVHCAPTATLEASFALTAPAGAPLAPTPERVDAPDAPSFAVRTLAPDPTGSPPEPSPRAARGRAPPIA